MEEVTALISLVKQEGSDNKAKKALVQVINRPEYVPVASFGPVSIFCLFRRCSQISSNECLSANEVCHHITEPTTGCLEVLIEAGTSGQLEVHNEVKKSDITVGELIGKGKAGKVFQGTYQGRTVAIKQFNNPEKLDDREFRKELVIMSLVREPKRLLPCLGGSSKKGNKFLVAELMETSVYDLIHDKGVDIDDRLRLVMARQIARDMQYLHSRNIIHRDLKSLNLLINTRFEIKICDFGLSRVIDKNQPMTSNIGTVAWIAPEIFSNKKLYTEKADVYRCLALFSDFCLMLLIFISFAVILWELLTRQMPFGEAEAFTIPVLVTKGKRCESGTLRVLRSSL